MLAFFWYRLEFPYQKCLKNKTECSPLFCSSFFGTVPPIVLPKMCKKTRRIVRLFFGTVPPMFSPKMLKNHPIFVILGVRGYPWHPLGGHRDRDPVYLRILGGFGESFWRPWATLGPPCAPPLLLFGARCPAFVTFFGGLGRRPDFSFILGCPLERKSDLFGEGRCA